ncbi:hypothetical protein BV25DRAFT_1418289 [Artomyces pyxidatus]|uniref:Uncharacterized protein n=1 Tax=Artomyces pyxidatus TaxID=48021 RepID=A0ACB8TE34_9AGAM|nr:hypothetical protein BV25DRAFT_1418289 [Artomyces pyxidatus]
MNFSYSTPGGRGRPTLSRTESMLMSRRRGAQALSCCTSSRSLTPGCIARWTRHPSESTLKYAAWRRFHLVFDQFVSVSHAMITTGLLYNRREPSYTHLLFT